MPAAKTTLLQIAKETGFSASTVSRVLSGSSYPVNKKTREAIIQAAQRHQYAPPSLRKLTSTAAERNTIGVIIPTMTNPFYTQLICGIEKKCEQYGYTPIVCSSRRNPKKEIENLKIICESGAKGILISSINDDLSFLSALARQNFPIVVFDQSIEALDVSYVKFDYYAAGKLAVEHLYLKGHRRIAYLSPPLNRSVRRDALEGYRHGLEEFLLPFREEYVIIADEEYEYNQTSYDFEKGAELARRLVRLPELPTAVFTINDIMAFGVISGLSALGLRVPEDISIVGFDNLEVSAISNPPLTTINQPAFEIGHLSAKILFDQLTGKSTERKSLNLRASIVERGSVKSMY